MHASKKARKQPSTFCKHAKNSVALNCDGEKAGNLIVTVSRTRKLEWKHTCNYIKVRKQGGKLQEPNRFTINSLKSVIVLSMFYHVTLAVFRIMHNTNEKCIY